ncbi:glycosyltransferase family 39 protein [Pelagibacterium montanilacus]|uniref:glycosyltransferase family 39 protein n=1 Tax=Pelagibacterium montanilacus TaxID=2185280 RepID=UPI000F8EE995|nr:glycosyltransferase family 39 protein [Pelagibacterium montanilacus]
MAGQGDRVGPFTPLQATLVLIGITFVLRMIGAWAIGWGTGEAYYLSSSRVLHLSYFDQPPLSLWVIWAMREWTGSEATWVLRAPFVLMFSVSTLFVYMIGRRLYSPLGGFYAALIVNACVLFSLSVGSWMQPDAPMLMFWLATVLVLLEILIGRAGQRRPYLWWGLAGLLLGLTFLSKYHAVFLVAGTGLFLLSNSTARPWLAHRAPWVALAVALLVFSPVIAWNYQTDWASFGFQGGRALGGELHWDRLLRMIWGQLLYMVPWLAIPALWFGARALVAGPRGQYPTGAPSGSAALLAYIGWPPILFFTLVALWADTQFHFHWQAPGYLMLFILMGGWAARRNGPFIRFWLYGSAITTLVVLTLLVSHAATGWARQMFPGDWEDPTALQLHWRELGVALAARGAFDQPETFVASTGWIECGHVDPQVAGRLPLACLSDDARNLAYNVNLEALTGWDAYVVVQSSRVGSVPDRIEEAFETIEHLETIGITRGGVVELDDIQLYRAEGYRP